MINSNNDVLHLANSVGDLGAVCCAQKIRHAHEGFLKVCWSFSPVLLKTKSSVMSLFLVLNLLRLPPRSYGFCDHCFDYSVQPQLPGALRHSFLDFVPHRGCI